MSDNSNIVVSDVVDIRNMIYTFRRKIMVDSDLVALYQVTTGNLNKAMKRNI